FSLFYFIHPPTSHIYTLSLHDALPISMIMQLHYRGNARASSRHNREFGSNMHCKQTSAAGAALQKRDNVRSSDGRKPGEKIVDCVSRLKVVQQRLDGHARTGEHWRSPHDLRRAAHDGRAHAHTLPPSTALDEIGRYRSPRRADE